MPRFHDIMPEQADISANDGQDWRMLILKAYGVEVPGEHRQDADACRASSTSARRSSRRPSRSWRRASTSPVIAGPSAASCASISACKIPTEASGRPATIMMIDDREYRITDGECLLWDDTYPHEVMNNADEPRIALLLDVWRPDMPLDMEILSRLIVGAVQIGMRYRGVSYTRLKPASRPNSVVLQRPSNRARITLAAKPDRGITEN